MTYLFDVDLSVNVFIREGETADGMSVPWREVSEEEEFSGEKINILPAMIRVEVYGDGEVVSLPAVLKYRSRSGNLFFSDDVRMLLETVEPGVHKFHPVDVRIFPRPERELDRVVATYHMWLSPPELMSVIPELSAYQAGVGVHACIESAGYFSSSLKEPCTLKGEAITGRHCWREVYRKHVQGADGLQHVIRTFNFFCSAELYSGIKFGRMEGFDFIKKCQIK